MICRDFSNRSGIKCAYRWVIESDLCLTCPHLVYHL